MKKFLIGFAVFVALIGAGLYALSRYVSPAMVQAQVVQKVKEATGRDISFDAMQPAFFFPNIGLRLRNVTFSNASWAHDKHMLELEELDLHLALKPLLDHRVEIASLTLKKPVIHLETSADGKGNWVMAKQAGAETEKPAAEKPGKTETPGASSGFGFKFGHMQITGGGTLTYRDGKKGTVEKFDGVNASLTYPDFTSPMQMDGEFNYKGKRVNLLVNLTKPLDFFAGKVSDGDVTVTAPDTRLRISGNLATNGTLFGGHLDSTISALSDFAGWLQGGQTKLPFEKFSLSADVKATEKEAALTGVKLQLDDVNASGNIAAQYAGRPNVKAKLALDHLDLDKFTEASKQTAEVKGEKSSAPKTASDWDDKPMDFGGLKAADADLTLETKGFTVKGANVGPSTLTATLNDGVLHVKNSEAAMFSGTFSADLTVNAATSVPTLAARVNVANVQAKPMLTAFANFKKLEGTGNITADVTASGNSQKAIVSSLAGKGMFDFKNGAIEGLDLADIAKMIQNGLKDMNVGEGKTDFVDTGGTYTIAKGIVHNDDFKLKGPLVQATGAGDVDLPNKQINYRVESVLTASSAVDQAKGLHIPVVISGPFSRIRAKPDFRSAVKNIMDNPDDAKAAVKTIRDQSKSIIKAFKENPDALGALLGLKKKQPAPVQPDVNATSAPPDTVAPAPAPEAAPAPASP